MGIRYGNINDDKQKMAAFLLNAAAKTFSIGFSPNSTNSHAL